ncbi:MAG: TonB-dependent receptor [Acidobacteria bacterium]|nr:TonB-dependent receptor [Acidobacteriota bacterium]
MSRKLLVLFSLLFVLSSNLFAQLTTGTISGTVTDTTGGVIPGAQITVKNTDTGVARSLVTDAGGRYEAPSLPLGNYEVTAELSGFQTTIRRGIGLTVGRHAVVDLVLQVGEITQAVTVTGEAALVETTTATVSNLVDEKRVGDLPLNNRDLTQLTFLQPGVLQIPTSGAQGVFSGLGAKLTVAGSRQTQNVYLLDGVSNSDLSGNAQSASGAYLGVDAIKEFQIITNNYSAEYRSQAGAIISAVTKSGTNEFHGSAFWFHRNDNLDAANFFDNAFGNPKPEFKRNQLGGSLGGPIIKDKTFFFGSYEGLRERLSTTDEARVPTLDARRGILPNRTVQVNPVAKPYLDLYPIPGQGNTVVQDFGDGTVRIAGNGRQPTESDFVTARIDHHFASEKLGSLSGTYNFDDSERSPFGILGDLTEGDSGGNGITSEKHVVSASHTSVLSPTTLNEFNFGYSVSDVFGDVPLSKRDFSGLRFHPNRELMGQINAGELSSIGFRVNFSEYEQKVLTFKDGLSLTRGNHSFRLGGEINRFRYKQDSCSRGCNGIYDFRTLETFLRGIPRRFQVFLPGSENPERNLSQLFVGVYFQDNWQVRPSLTLNLGLRYEFTTVPEEDDNQISNLVSFNDSFVSVPASIVAKFPNLTFAGTIDDWYDNPTLKSFSPRFGFAWAPRSRKTSLRGGFGLFYEHPMLFNFRTSLQELPPFVLVGRAEDRDAERAGTTLRFPDAFTTQLSLLRGRPNIRSFEFDLKNTYMYRWSLTLQRELGSDWVVSAGYTGSRALHLWTQGLPNINRWEGWPENPKGPKFFPPGGRAINPNFGEVRIQSSNANSWFQGLAVGAQKRMSRGLQVQLAYNLSKAIDQGSGVTSGGEELPETQRGIYFWDMQLKKGRAGFDIRNSFVGNFTYEFPQANLDGVGAALVNGWQINGILSLVDGHPLTVIDSSEAQTDRIGDNESLRVDLIPGGNNDPLLGGPDRYYDVSQFTPSRLGFFGTLGRGTVTSPGVATLDFSLFKNFKLTEESRFQFRAEFFNLFNRANFATPDMTPFTTAGRPDANAGRITGTSTSARQVQFGLKYIF